MERFANKSNINFPFQECVVSKGQATATADHLFLLDKRPQNPWEAINGCEAGMPLMTSWQDGYYTANKRSTDRGPRDIGPVVPTV
jgi:hypothetical protein